MRLVWITLNVFQSPPLILSLTALNDVAQRPRQVICAFGQTGDIHDHSPQHRSFPLQRLPSEHSILGRTMVSDWKPMVCTSLSSSPFVLA
jgi:hypothetical protein